MLGRGSGVKPVHAVGQRLAAQAEARAAQQEREDEERGLCWLSFFFFK